MQSDAGERPHIIVIHLSHCLQMLEIKSTSISYFRISLPALLWPRVSSVLSHGLCFRHGTSAVHRVRKLVSGHGIDVVALGIDGRRVRFLV